MTSGSNKKLLTNFNEYSLLPCHAESDVIAWHKGEAILAEEFLQNAYTLASQLPTNQYAINLCEDRYWFLVGFAALLINNQTNLLPPNRASQVIEEIAQDYPDSFCLCDSDLNNLKLPAHQICDIKTDNKHAPYSPPLIPAQHLAAIVFTSGSTGKSSPNFKYWADLVTGTKMQQQRFGFGEDGHKQTIIATVPPQHMYGLETSILNPLINGISVFTDKTFFPIDISSALNSTPEPRVLITTPVHLKSCVHSDIDWPNIDFIISATAPLDKALAIQAEEKFNCHILEIFGCTEAGSLASRRTVKDDSWTLYEGTSLIHSENGYSVSGPNLPENILLNDVIEPTENNKFILRGRNTDMINIAGKRASLADLNIRLNRIEGIEDAIFFEPDLNDKSNTKLAALVVAPTLNKDQIRRKLAPMIDPVFLPRPLILLEKLPRNETGKLPRTALLETLNKTRSKN